MDVAKRKRNSQAVFGSMRLEGLEPTGAVREAVGRYEAGDITLDEMLAELGLEPSAHLPHPAAAPVSS